MSASGLWYIRRARGRLLINGLVQHWCLRFILEQRVLDGKVFADFMINALSNGVRSLIIRICLNRVFLCRRCWLLINVFASASLRNLNSKGQQYFCCFLRNLRHSTACGFKPQALRSLYLTKFRSVLSGMLNTIAFLLLRMRFVTSFAMMLSSLPAPVAAIRSGLSGALTR